MGGELKPVAYACEADIRALTPEGADLSLSSVALPQYGMKMALYASPPPPSGSAWGVKPLEWIPGTWHGTVVFKAKSICGEYMVAPKAWNPGWLWRLDYEEDVSESYSSAIDEDEAKAAAQADYDARILSALTPSPSYAEGIEAAAKVAERQAELVPPNTKAFRAYQDACRHVASNIRSLAGKPPAEDVPNFSEEISGAIRHVIESLEAMGVTPSYETGDIEETALAHLIDLEANMPDLPCWQSKRGQRDV